MFPNHHKIKTLTRRLGTVAPATAGRRPVTPAARER